MMWVKNLLLKATNLLYNNQRGEIKHEREIRRIPLVPPFYVEGLSSSALHSCQAESNEVSPQDCVPQKTSSCQRHVQQPDTTAQLPAIYSGIGLGVYQGEAVVFLQMAVGERRWTVSKLRFEDLALFPYSILSEVCLLLCLLRLNNIQSDLVKNGLQTKGGIELMRSLCPLAGNLDKLLASEADGSNPALLGQRECQRQQSQCLPICSICPIYLESCKSQLNTKGESEQ